MLATQLNGHVDNKELDKNVVIKLTSFVTNAVQGRKWVPRFLLSVTRFAADRWGRLIIVLGIELQDWTGDKIGNPTNLEQANLSAPAAAPAPVTNGASKAAAPSKPAPRAGGKDMGPLYPIEGLSPYQNKWVANRALYPNDQGRQLTQLIRWTIKARVTQKSDIKHWSNQRGEGKVFNVTLMDETVSCLRGIARGADWCSGRDPSDGLQRNCRFLLRAAAGRKGQLPDTVLWVKLTHPRCTSSPELESTSQRSSSTTSTMIMRLVLRGIPRSRRFVDHLYRRRDSADDKSV